jgi:hypothetical protein
MMLTAILGLRNFLPATRKLKLSLLAVIPCLIGLYVLAYVSYTGDFHITWRRSTAVGYYFRSASDDLLSTAQGMVEYVASAGAKSTHGPASLPWLFPVGGENETNHRIVEALNLMGKYALENRTSVNRTVKVRVSLCLLTGYATKYYGSFPVWQQACTVVASYARSPLMTVEHIDGSM